MDKKGTLFKKAITNPLYFIREVCLINNFIAGIIVFFAYLILVSTYVYLQIREGIEVLPKEVGLIFFTDKIKMDIENIRLTGLLKSFFSSEILRLFIMSIIAYLLITLITRKRTSVSQIITTITVSYTIPCYLLIVGHITILLPLSFVIFKICEITFFISLYEAISKGFGITKGSSFIVTLLLVLLENVLYIIAPSLFLTPFLI